MLHPLRQENSVRVLIACEFSGIVRDAFLMHGHSAWSCDLLPTESPGPHFQEDIFTALGFRGPWDLLIAFPPCTYLSRAGARWWEKPGRELLARKAAQFVLDLWNQSIPHIAIENPIGQLNRRWRYPDQTIQPWQFGHPYSKATCLWLKNLPPLTPTKLVEKYQAFLPSNTGWNARRGGHTQPGVIHNAKDASRTFQGIADAMADQWSRLVP